MKHFSTILQEAPDISVILNNHQSYRAHIHKNKPAESLHEHITLVNSYAYALIKVHHLDEVIDRLIYAYVENWDWDKKMAACQLKVLFTHTIVFHDFGKVNPVFQEKRMENKLNISLLPTPDLQPAHGHSQLGSYLFIAYHIQQIFELSVPDMDKQLLMCHCFFMAYPIMQHHSPVFGDILHEGEYMTRFHRLVDQLEQYTIQYNLKCNKDLLSFILTKSEQIWKDFQKHPKAGSTNSFPLFALLKLNFSLLTAADYLATHEYMNSSEGGKEFVTTDFGIFDAPDRIAEITLHLRQFRHNAATFSNIDSYHYLHPKEKSSTNLNRLRQEMAVEIIQNIRNHSTAQLFYIEAPTGGGKTNLSAIALTELISTNQELNKIFYVFPFTTLITQTTGILKESLRLHPHEIAELHSKAPYQSKNSYTDSEQTKDGLYGNEQKDYIDQLFALYPITLLSHIKFFDILKSNAKESNYLLHRLANSVVIMDEIQSYPPVLWDKMLYFINQYAYFFNIRFILMSATLPKISELNIGITQNLQFIDLLPNARKYMTNENFSERVTFKFLNEKKKITLPELCESVLSVSAQYAKNNTSVRTIVEFIYKKSAAEFTQLIKEQSHPFDHIFILSGTILDSRRKEIINFIKQSGHKKINILLITTQVVEAGVDIDMDIGFKNISLIDADEQLAGRVNRNAQKDRCEVYLFNLDNAGVLYGNDYRFKETRDHISQETHLEILQAKDFRRLYEKVLFGIDKINKLHFSDNFPGYESAIQSLRFRTVDANFRIINQDTQTVFVPMPIPIYTIGPEEGQYEAVFSGNDWNLLKTFGVEAEGNTLDGSKVWKIYESLIERRSEDKKPRASSFDLNNKILLKTLQQIMNKFCFSLLAMAKDYQQLIAGFGEIRYGYLYFTHWNEDRENGKPYNYNSGLNNRAFSDANFI